MAGTGVRVKNIYAGGGKCCCASATVPCTACGGCCCDTPASLVVDISSLTACSDCFTAPPGMPFPTVTSTVTLDHKNGSCSNNVTWTPSSSQVLYQNKIVSVVVNWNSSTKCYVLSIYCSGNVNGNFETIYLFQGCKGGNSPTGTYYCQDNGSGVCTGCNSSALSLTVNYGSGATPCPGDAPNSAPCCCPGVPPLASAYTITGTAQVYSGPNGTGSLVHTINVKIGRAHV